MAELSSRTFLVCCAVLLGLVAPLAAETLIQQGNAGGYEPGLASSWRSENGGLIVTLKANQDAQAIASVLRDSLSAGEVVVAGQTITISGIPQESLLTQLATLHVSGADTGDPLAQLGDLGNVVAASEPEGGGSIRAAKPHTIMPVPTSERAAAEVVDIRRGEFPQVTLVLRIRTAPQAGPMRRLLRRGKRIKGSVVFSTRPDQRAIDFNNTDTQRNLAGYYLSRGDRIFLRATGTDTNKLEFDYVERR